MDVPIVIRRLLEAGLIRGDTLTTLHSADYFVTVLTKITLLDKEIVKGIVADSPPDNVIH